MDPRQQLVGRGVELRATVEHVGAKALEQLADPGACDDRQHAAAHRGGALTTRDQRCRLVVHIGDVEMGHLAGPGKHGGGALRLVGVNVDLQRRRVADDQQRITEGGERGGEAARIESLPRDGEVGAVAIGR